LVTSPVISGSTATETLPSGQQLFIQTLLPQSPSITSAFGAGNLNPVAQLEPTQYILTVEDPAKPADVHFLHVLQGTDPGAPMVAATYLQSAGGTAFDGALFGSNAVFFPVSGGSFAGTTFTVPSTVHTLLVSGLSPNVSYGAAVQIGAGGTAITLTPGGPDTTADGAGLVRLIF
jgi:hypothetical protein